MKKWHKKLIAIAILAALYLCAWLYFDMSNLITIDMIKAHRAILVNTVAHRYWFAAALFMLAYFINTACAIPGSALLTMTGGFLFGPPAGTVYTVISASLGSTIAFLLTRYFLGSTVQQKYHTQLAHFNAQLQLNGAWYLITLRLNPIVPFFLVNTLSGLTLIPLQTFFLTTFIGIIPIVSIYSYLGRELLNINCLNELFTPRFMLILSIMSIIAMTPLLFKLVKNIKK
jgi:Uncharacterized conserved protein